MVVLNAGYNWEHLNKEHLNIEHKQQKKTTLFQTAHPFYKLISVWVHQRIQMFGNRSALLTINNVTMRTVMLNMPSITITALKNKGLYETRRFVFKYIHKLIVSDWVLYLRTLQSSKHN